MQKQTVLPATPEPPAVTLFTPVFVFSLLFIIAGLLSFSTSRWAQRALNVFDSIFFLFIGFVGLLIITLWAIRVDTVCRNNFNLTWALPTHFFVAFVVWLKRKWLQQYFRAVFALTLLFGISWVFIPQQINMAVLPILGIILLRSYFRGNLPVKKRNPDQPTKLFHHPKTTNIEL
jgi:hypothetical protein